MNQTLPAEEISLLLKEVYKNTPSGKIIFTKDKNRTLEKFRTLRVVCPIREGESATSVYRSMMDAVIAQLSRLTHSESRIFIADARIEKIASLPEEMQSPDLKNWANSFYKLEVEVAISNPITPEMLTYKE